MSQWWNSLAGRMLLLLAAALFIGQAINFALLLSEVRARRATFTEGGAIARTVDTVERFEGGLPAARMPAGGPERLTVTINASAAGSQTRDRTLESRLADALAGIGYADATVRAGRDQSDASGEHLLISVQLRDGRWLNLRSRLPPGDGRLVVPLLGQTLILFLALLIAVFLIVRHVAGPMRHLTQAAERFGTNQSVGAVALQGPADIQRLIASFNHMQTRILQMLDEKDRMLGAIGHDLRTPLASLRLRAETVTDQTERERMIATIDEMANTLDEILSLARLGRSAEKPVRVDLSALVDALVQDLQDLDQPVKLQVHEKVLASVRPVLMRRALRNIIENAVTYGSRASVRLFREGTDIVIMIDDDGPGVAEKDLDRVMEGFVRLEESRNRDTGGSGLGLTIARSVIHEHGGTLALTNLPEGGLRASIRLPAEPTG